MKKLLNKKGFTLMEMLIVIAIIVILVAIAVPSFNSSLNSAKSSTDAANLRAAKSAAQLKTVEETYKTGTHYFYYDLVKGDVVFLDTTGSKKPSDLSDVTDANWKGACDNHNAAYIKVKLKGGAVESVEWSENPTGCTE